MKKAITWLLFFNITALCNSIIWHNPIDLVNSKRFSVMAKYIFAKHYHLNIQSPWSFQLYYEHLKVWNNFKERFLPGFKTDKNCFADYLNKFYKTITSIKKKDLIQINLLFLSILN